MNFGGNITEQVFLTSHKLEMNLSQTFKRKCIVNFRKYRSKKEKFIFGGVKTAKSNKTKKTEELIAAYQETVCLWNVLSLSYKNKLMANGPNKPNQKVCYAR